MIRRIVRALLVASVVATGFAWQDRQVAAQSTPACGTAMRVLVISRDAILLVGTLVLYLLNGKVHVKPHWTGKVATVLQMVAIGWVMLQLRVVPLLYVVLAAGAFTMLSGIVYVTDGVRQLQAEGHAHPAKS